MKDFENELEAYKRFRDEKLIPERNQLKNNFEKLENEIKNYEMLVIKCEEFDETEVSNNHPQESVKIPLDLGCGYSVDFEVFDKEFVLVSVGFGFYAQMTWKEAAGYSEKRIKMLKSRQSRLKDKMRKLEEHLKLTDECISALSK